MKRFLTILVIVAAGCIAISMLFKIISFDPFTLEGFFAADGAFDGPASSAVQALDSGLLIAGLVLLLIAAIFFILERIPGGPYHWSVGNFLLLLVGIKLSLCLIYVFLTPYKPWTDDKWFYEQAINLANGIDPVTSDGEPTALWPIGYSLLLSVFFRIFGSNLFVGQAVNIFLLLGMSLFTYFLGRDLFEDGVARRAALIITLMPSQIFFALPMMSDVLLAFLVLLIIYLAQKQMSATNFVVMGILFGFAVLTKPVVLFLPLSLGTYWLLRDRRWMPVLLHVLIIFLIGGMVLLPWQIRNQKVFGQFALVSTQGGLNTFRGNNPNASGGFIMAQDFIGPEMWESMKGMNEAEKDQYLFKLATQWAMAHPIGAISVWPKKVMALYYEDSKCVNRSLHLSYKNVSNAIISGMIFTTEGYYYALGLSFIIGFVILIRNERISTRVWLILGTILYFTVIYFPFVAEGRYHTVLLPLFATVAFAGSSNQNLANHKSA